MSKVITASQILNRLSRSFGEKLQEVFSTALKSLMGGQESADPMGSTEGTMSVFANRRKNGRSRCGKWQAPCLPEWRPVWIDCLKNAVWKSGKMDRKRGRKEPAETFS